MSVGWMQVYNDKILDLTANSNASLDLREGTKNIVVSGLVSTSIKSMDEFWTYHE